MSKPVFVYTLACETCGAILTPHPTHQVVITDLKRDHARKHREQEDAILAALDARGES